jgi:hypothetical protein
MAALQNSPYRVKLNHTNQTASPGEATPRPLSFRAIETEERVVRPDDPQALAFRHPILHSSALSLGGRSFMTSKAAKHLRIAQRIRATVYILMLIIGFAVLGYKTLVHP